MSRRRSPAMSGISKAPTSSRSETVTFLFVILPLREKMPSLRLSRSGSDRSSSPQAFSVPVLSSRRCYGREGWVKCGALIGPQLRHRQALVSSRNAMPGPSLLNRDRQHADDGLGDAASRDMRRRFVAHDGDELPHLQARGRLAGLGGAVMQEPRKVRRALLVYAIEDRRDCLEVLDGRAVDLAAPKFAVVDKHE